MATLQHIQQKLVSSVEAPQLAQWREALAYELWAAPQSLYRLELNLNLIELMDDELDRSWRPGCHRDTIPARSTETEEETENVNPSEIQPAWTPDERPLTRKLVRLWPDSRLPTILAEYEEELAKDDLDSAWRAEVLALRQLVQSEIEERREKPEPRRSGPRGYYRSPTHPGDWWTQDEAEDGMTPHDAVWVEGGTS